MRRPGVRAPSAPPFIFNHLQPPATVAVLVKWPIREHFFQNSTAQLNRRPFALRNSRTQSTAEISSPKSWAILNSSPYVSLEDPHYRHPSMGSNLYWLALRCRLRIAP